ncbi:MAG: sugar ABC transporter substrate-binding protein [Vicinamibacteria bacterium]
MTRSRAAAALLLTSLLAALPLACRGDHPAARGGLTIGVAFETLQTEFWVAALGAFEDEIRRRGGTMEQAIADGDANRQLDQVRSLIARRVDGIVLVPKDAKACLPIIRAANEAGIPIVLFNRPAEKSDLRSTAVVADNFALTKETVAYLVAQARKSGRKAKAMVLIGDLGDINAVGRRDGFDAAVAEAGDAVSVVARIPTEWNQEKAQAGLVNALQAHPDVDLVFASSDFLFPSVVSALQGAGRYRKAGEPGHVVLGGFDGDATAWRLLEEGYVDATGVQDVYFEARAALDALLDAKAGKPVPEIVRDPGFVIHQGNRAEMAPRMWGAGVRK